MDKETRRDRYNPRTESLLKQFQKWGEGGCQAQTRDWDCRYEYMFTLADEHKKMVDDLVSVGADFNDAFETVMMALGKKD